MKGILETGIHRVHCEIDPALNDEGVDFHFALADGRCMRCGEQALEDVELVFTLPTPVTGSRFWLKACSLECADALRDGEERDNVLFLLTFVALDHLIGTVYG